MSRMPIAERRRALLQAAFEVIAEQGIAAATTRTIAARAQMPLASFHYAFESHTDLMGELMEAVIVQESQTIDEHFAVGDDLLHTVRLGLHAFLEHLFARPDMERAVIEMRHFAARNPDLQHLAPLMFTRFRETASQLLHVCEDAGFVWHASIDDLAYQVIAVTAGLTNSYLVDGDQERCRKAVDALAVGIAAQGSRAAEPAVEIHRGAERD